MSSLRLEIPFLPPTSNHIYVNRRGGGRFLSKEALSFQRRFSAEVVGPNLAAISALDTKAAYQLYMQFFFAKDDVFTKTASAASKYKKMDLQNRIKLITDSLCTAIGIDDSQFFQETYEKQIGDGKVLIWLQKLELPW